MHKFGGATSDKSFKEEVLPIHLRRRHFLGGEGSKICQICGWIVLKNCQQEGSSINNVASEGEGGVVKIAGFT